VWDTPGVSIKDADFLGDLFPWPVVYTLSMGASQIMATINKDMLDGLKKARGALKRGDKGDYLVSHQFIKGAYLYLDQGACQIIINRQIKVRRCKQRVERYYPKGIMLANGTKVKSNLIILVTGIKHGKKVIKQIIGKDIINKVSVPLIQGSKDYTIVTSMVFIDLAPN
jgi:hypothetical protein